MKAPPAWTEAELDSARTKSEEHFRQGRHTEPLEIYLDLFDEYEGVVEEVLGLTGDLANLRAEVLGLLAASRFRSDPGLADRLVGFIQDWHDRRRFPWVKESRKPEKHDRKAAILATSTLLAMRRLETMRRNQGKKLQEELVATQLRRSRFDPVPPRKVSTLSKVPKPGQFCRECLFGSRKADFVIGLHDGRTMALEYKVSNSATNSIKRLNNDAAIKAVTWRNEFGTAQVVTAAVLGGVYALRNLIDAQEKGLTIFRVHDLTAMLEWMRATQPNHGS